MKISIIVPVYNVEKYVVRCLESIRNQVWTDYEVIIVDDGSTDDSGKIAEEYCKKDSRFSVFHKKNGGLVAAWMDGVGKSTGDYIGFVDSDDYIDYTMYQKMAEKALKYDADIVLCNHFYDSREAGGKLQVHHNPISEGFYTGERLEEIKVKAFPELGKDYISPARCNKLIRKTLLESNLKYCNSNVSSAEDVMSMVPNLIGCNSLYYIDAPLYYYICRKTSISNSFNDRYFEKYKTVIELLSQAIRDKEKPFEEKEKQLYNFYGTLWCIYISRAAISEKEKEKQFLRLFENDKFLNASKAISKENGTTALIYKFAIQKKCPKLFFTLKRVIEAIRK